MPISPVFSIVVPSRNRPLDLEIALLSIKQQSFQAFEVLVVDDGSAKSTRDAYPVLIKKLDERFKFLILGNPGDDGRGPSYVRNYGIHQASPNSCFVAFLDDDDFWCEPDHLEKAYEILMTSQNADLYIANQQGLRDGQPCIPSLMSRFQANKNQWQTIADNSYRVPKDQCIKLSLPIPHLNIVILRRSLLEKVGGFTNHIPYFEDGEFIFKAMDQSKQILFRDHIVCTHNIPSEEVGISASTRHNEMEKRLHIITVANRLCASATTKAGIWRSKWLAGDAYRHLTHMAVSNGQIRAASHYALKGLVAWQTARFCLFTVYLYIKALVSEK